MKTRTLVGIFAIALVLILAGIIWRLTKDVPLTPTIGAILPLTGDVASYGIAVKEGIDLALDEVNNAGGISGQTVTIIYEDDGGDPKSGVSSALKLISVDKVNAIIGAVPSSVTLAIAPIAEKSGIVLLSPASSSPKITTAGDFIFRNYPSDELEGRLVADFTYHHNFKSAAVVTIKNDYGQGLKTIFNDRFSHLGGLILHDEDYSEGEQDFRSLLTKIKKANPDCIFIVGYGIELGTMVKQGRELGLTQQFFSTVNFYDTQSIESGGSAVDGVIFSSPVFDPNSIDPTIRNFVDSFKIRFNHIPDVWSAHGFDALNLLVFAMRENGISRSDIKDGLYSISAFPGVSGTTSFDENGDVLKEARFLTVKEGQFVPYSE